jgi:ribosomal-protein-serine acetyltransferase
MRPRCTRRSRRASPSPWITWAAREPVPLPELRERLVRYAAELAAGDRWRYAVLHRGTNALLGGASLHPYPGPGALEVGYWVRTRETGRGIARAAAATLIRRAFAAHGVDHVEIWSDPGNAASLAVARALGLAPAGTRVTRREDGSPRLVEVLRRDDAEGLPAIDVLLRAV